MAYTLPPLPYSFDALEPYIDARTMEIHHNGHHAKYVEELNKAVHNFPELAQKPVADLLMTLPTLPTAIQTAVCNNGGGHYNHSLFWQMLSPKGGKPAGAIAKELQKKFSSFEQFKELFNEQAKKVFGSGWAWLVIDQQGQLQVIATPNQDSPISQGMHPLLGLDVWEHAYYLKYQNKRVDYIQAWWHVVNWDYVEQRYGVVRG